MGFIDKNDISEVIAKWGTPVFVYSEQSIADQVNKALSIQPPFGLTVRYAMKANPTRAIIKYIYSQGVKIDASSGYEADRALLAGVKPEDISITSQELPKNLKLLVEQGVWFNACSLYQLEEFGKIFNGHRVGVRINPGQGSGYSNKAKVGGPSASFGIWHEYIDEIKDIAQKYKLNVTTIHTHIGTGSDPDVWLKVVNKTIALVNDFDNVDTIDLGGGYKVARMSNEQATDLQAIGKIASTRIQDYYKKTGRKLKLEIEPGNYLVANSAYLITSVIDIVDTGRDGYKFIKVDTGMNDILRPSLYGAQHPIDVINNTIRMGNFVVVGHCCESGDILTTTPGKPEELSTRKLNIPAIGDPLIIGGVGAFCTAMNARNYNSFPACTQVIKTADGSYIPITRAESVDDIVSLEI